MDWSGRVSGKTANETADGAADEAGDGAAAGAAGRAAGVSRAGGGRWPRRLVQLYAGLALYGFSMAMMLRAGLGLDPWDVFHQGLQERTPLSFGMVTVVVGAAVLLLWWPLRQWPGLGTVSNVVVIGVSVDASLRVLPDAEGLGWQVVFMAGSVVLNAVAGGAYIGARLGPGPRDGLMTGLVRRTGRSVRLVRTCIEVAVLAAGLALGGSAGVGTVVYALGIGPLVQVFLPLLTVPDNAVPDGAGPDRGPARAAAADAPSAGGATRAEPVCPVGGQPSAAA